MSITTQAQIDAFYEHLKTYRGSLTFFSGTVIALASAIIFAAVKAEIYLSPSVRQVVLIMLFGAIVGSLILQYLDTYANNRFVQSHSYVLSEDRIGAQRTWKTFFFVVGTMQWVSLITGLFMVAAVLTVGYSLYKGPPVKTSSPSPTAISAPRSVGSDRMLPDKVVK
jgi:hypothetical protein